jgi:hypothetical protein
VTPGDSHLDVAGKDFEPAEEANRKRGAGWAHDSLV